MSTVKLLTWHRGDEEWYATNADGETVVRAYRRRPSGDYYGTWATSGLFHRYERLWTRFSEIKEAAERRYAEKVNS